MGSDRRVRRGLRGQSMADHEDRDCKQVGRSAGAGMLERFRGYLERRAHALIPQAMRGKVGASDLVQEAFVDAARRVEEMPAGRSDELRAWLYRIMALNLAEQRRRFLGTARANVLREVRLEATPPRPGVPTLREGLAGDGESPSDRAMGREEEGLLADAIATLPDAEREVVMLRYWERLEYAEIGRRMGGRSADAARMLHARACKRLFRQLGGEAP